MPPRAGGSLSINAQDPGLSGGGRPPLCSHPSTPSAQATEPCPHSNPTGRGSLWEEELWEEWGPTFRRGSAPAPEWPSPGPLSASCVITRIRGTARGLARLLLKPSSLLSLPALDRLPFCWVPFPLRKQGGSQDINSQLREATGRAQP